MDSNVGRLILEILPFLLQESSIFDTSTYLTISLIIPRVLPLEMWGDQYLPFRKIYKSKQLCNKREKILIWANIGFHVIEKFVQIEAVIQGSSPDLKLSPRSDSILTFWMKGTAALYKFWCHRDKNQREASLQALRAKVLDSCNKNGKIMYPDWNPCS